MVHVGFVSHIIFQAGEVISSFHPLYSSQRFSEVASFASFPAQRHLSAGLLCPALLWVLRAPLVNKMTIPVREFLDGGGLESQGGLGKLQVKSLASGAFCPPNTENEKAQPSPRRFLIASYNQFQITIISL